MIQTDTYNMEYTWVYTDAYNMACNKGSYAGIQQSMY